MDFLGEKMDFVAREEVIEIEEVEQRQNNHSPQKKIEVRVSLSTTSRDDFCCSTTIQSVENELTIEELLLAARPFLTSEIPGGSLVAVFSTHERKKKVEEETEVGIDGIQENKSRMIFSPEFGVTKLRDIFPHRNIRILEVGIRPLKYMDEINTFEKKKLKKVKTKEMFLDDYQMLGYPEHVVEVAYSRFKRDLKSARNFLDKNGRENAVKKLQQEFKEHKEEMDRVEKESQEMIVLTFENCPEIPIPKEKFSEFSEIKNIDDLGRDMVIHIFEYCDYKSLMSFSLTNSIFYQILSYSPFVWNIVMSKFSEIAKDQFFEYLVLNDILSMKPEENMVDMSDSGESVDSVSSDTYHEQLLPVPFLQDKLKVQLKRMVDLGHTAIKSLNKWTEEIGDIDEDEDIPSESSEEENKIAYFVNGRRNLNNSDPVHIRNDRSSLYTKKFLDEVLGSEFIPDVNFKRAFAEYQKKRIMQSLIPHVQAEKSRLSYDLYDRWSHKISVLGCFLVCFCCVGCCLMLIIPLLLGNAIPSPVYDETGSKQYFVWSNYFWVIPAVLLDCFLFPCFCLLYIKNSVASDFYPLFYVCKRTSTYFGNDRYATDRAPNSYDDVGFDFLTLILTPLLWIPIFVNVLFFKLLVFPGNYGRVMLEADEKGIEYSWIPGLFPYTYLLIIPILPCMCYGYCAFVCSGLSAFWREKKYFRFMVCSAAGLFVINFLIIIPMLIILGLHGDGILDVVAANFHWVVFRIYTEYFTPTHCLLCLMMLMILCVFCCQFLIPFCMLSKCRCRNCLEMIYEIYLPACCPCHAMSCLFSSVICSICCVAFLGCSPIVVKYVPVVFMISLAPVYAVLVVLCCCVCYYTFCFICAVCCIRFMD